MKTAPLLFILVVSCTRAHPSEPELNSIPMDPMPVKLEFSMTEVRDAVARALKDSDYSESARGVALMIAESCMNTRSGLGANADESRYLFINCLTSTRTAADMEQYAGAREKFHLEECDNLAVFVREVILDENTEAELRKSPYPPAAKEPERYAALVRRHSTAAALRANTMCNVVKQRHPTSPPTNSLDL